MARRDRRRTTGALAASILVHLALLLMLLRVAGSSPPATESRVETDFQVQLVTRPAPTTANASAVPRASHSAQRRADLAATRRATPQPRPVPAPPPRVARPAHRSTPQPPQVAAAPPLPRPLGAGPAAGAQSRGGAVGGAPGDVGRWAVQGEDEDGDGVRRFLRATVGCSHEEYVGLSEAERAACDRRIGREARSIGISPDKLGAFIAAAQAQERQRADRTGPMRDLFVPCKGEGSNLDRGCINMKTKHPEDEP